MNIKSVFVTIIFGCSLIGVQPKMYCLDKQQIVSRLGFAVGSVTSFWCLSQIPGIIDMFKRHNEDNGFNNLNREWLNGYRNKEIASLIIKTFLSITLTGISLKYLK